MKERRQAQSAAWQEPGGNTFSHGSEHRSRPSDWWNNGGDPTPFDLRWRGPFEGYR